MADRAPLIQLSRQLHMLIVAHRLPPNRAVRALVEANPEEDVERIMLAFLDTALALEEMYDQIKRDEWNDWLRVDYWEGIASHEHVRREGSARLLQVKSELYRAVGFLTLDMFVLIQSEPTPITAEKMLAFWRANDSDYFL